jgi:hypothetical protein
MWLPFPRRSGVREAGGHGRETSTDAQPGGAGRISTLACGRTGRLSVPITPDDKDWTWVLERPCPECGFDAAAVPPESVADALRANAAAWQRVLHQPDDTVRRRPSDDRWSALEYACHVRDVCTLYHQRLLLMLREDDPLYPNWDQDVTAVEARYGEQDPAVVSTELVEAAAGLADGFDGVRGDQWLRPGRRSDGARFDIAGFSRYLLHDPVHHLCDVTGHRGS